MARYDVFPNPEGQGLLLDIQTDIRYDIDMITHGF